MRKTIKEKMNSEVWLTTRLDSSAEELLWALEQIAASRLYALPPFGEWPAINHLLHLIAYEQRHALPTMKQWLGGPCPTPESSPPFAEPPLEQAVALFRQGRQQQGRLAESLPAAAWQQTHPTIWGEKTLTWVVTKTYQHTLDHTNELLQLALFWDDVLERRGV